MRRRPRFSNRVAAAYAKAALPRAFAFRAAASDAPAEILLYDEIGYWGVNASDFAAALAQAGDGPLTLRINSPGGDVFDGYAIHNMLRARTAPVAVIIDGVAASAASFIAMAGASLTMGEPSMLMIHNACGFSVGDRRVMTEMAAMLGKIDGQIAAVYAAKTGKPAEEMAALMDAETWLTGAEAKDAGFCDAPLAPPTKDAVANALRVAAPLARAIASRPRAAVEPYDPDGDGDNDAQEALDAIAMATSHLQHATRSLNGEDGGTPDGDDNPEARSRRRPRAAATTPEWMCSPADDLPIDADSSWDGPAATERMLDAAGFNGESPDPAKAKRGFLAWDHHNPKLKGSYKLPFADMVDGKLTAVKSGLHAAASRLPDTDIPDAVKASAQAVLDAYDKRMAPPGDAAPARVKAMRRRLALAAAEA